jgi:hypothetical protein
LAGSTAGVKAPYFDFIGPRLLNREDARRDQPPQEQGPNPHASDISTAAVCAAYSADSLPNALSLGIERAELFRLEYFRASMLHNAAEHHISSGGVVFS